MGEQNLEEALECLGSARSFPGLERLICISLADPDFAARLLADSAVALAQAAPAIQLSPAEQALAESIAGAADIHDFAAQLHAKVQLEYDRIP